MIWVLIILLIIILSAIIFILPVKIGINLEKSGEREELYVKVGIIFGISGSQMGVDLFKFHLDGLLPYILLQTKNRTYIENPWLDLKKLMRISPPFKLDIFLRLLKRMFEVNNRFFKEIVCQRLACKTNIGLGDPALTALSTGGIWVAKSILYMNLQRNVQVNFHKPVYEVNPIFNKTEFRVAFDCIFTFRLGHIIIAGCKVLVIYFKSLFAQRG